MWRRLCSSGWWIVLPLVLVCLGTVLMLVTPGWSGSGVWQAGHRGIPVDLSTCLVDRSAIVDAGLLPGGLPAVTAPVMLEPREVDALNRERHGKLLVGPDRVIGVEVRGDARAYPLRWLRWHEVVNDVVGELPIVVTYSGLCDSVSVAVRRCAGRDLQLAVSGLLVSSNPLLYDVGDEMQPISLWRQLDLTAVVGPAARDRQALTLLPAALTTWRAWRAEHPGTRVLAPDPHYSSRYRRDPYHSYFGSRLLRFPVAPLPPAEGPRLKDRVVVIQIGDVTSALVLSQLAAEVGAARGERDVVVGRVRARISFDADAGTAEVRLRDATDEPYSVRYAFWFAWYAHRHAASRQ